jgi:hypothetical protein
MKKLLTIAFAALIAMPAISQEEKLKELEKLEKNTDTILTKTDTVPKAESMSKKDTSSDRDTAIVEVGDEIFSVKEVGDETWIKIGNREYKVVEKDNGVSVYKGSGEVWHKRNKDRFRGHLGGLELGFDGFLTDFWSTTLEPEDNYFDLNTAKSYYWNILLPCVNIPFARHFGLVSSLGIAINKYRFDGNNSITKDENGVIGPYYPDPGITYSKSKFVTTYAIMPLIMEAQIPLSNSNHTINIGAGVIGAVKLGSNTKVVYYTESKQKDKVKDDFSLNTLRWGATGRIGYEFFQIYGTCYFTSLFEKGKGPELYPYEIGVAFTIND